MKHEIEKIERQTTQISQVYAAINGAGNISSTLSEMDQKNLLLKGCIDYIKSRAFQFPKKVEFKNGRPVIIERGNPHYNPEEQNLIDTYEQLCGGNDAVS